MELADTLKDIRGAFLRMSLLSGEQKDQALEAFARMLTENRAQLLQANEKDLQEQRGKISASSYQRLQLSEGKIEVLVQGIRDLEQQKDPCGQVQWRRELDAGLILERRTVPIGVIGIIFESRPDAVPQILSLILKSGNAAILKGGREALHSNRALMQVVEELNGALPFLPAGWAVLLETREETHEMLKLHHLIDLVIPRGSQELVRTVMENTRIPVLGHADGVCHIFLERSADLNQALRIIIDAKVEYPSACNAVETLLIDESVTELFLPKLHDAANENGMTLKGCPRVKRKYPNMDSVLDWSVEYGNPTLSVKIVAGLEEAVSHINRFGSHHTDAILTADPQQADRFSAAVDSASVMVNASTRFADGYRYGMGAELGISTSRIHARGPVGVEGLMTYKYILRGDGQIVGEYVGPEAKPFSHRDL